MISTTPSAQSRSVFTRSSIIFFLLLILALMPYRIHRNTTDRTFWIDETYTVLMVNHTFSDIVDITTFDAHPPGYYFILKCWLKPFRMLGFEPGRGMTRSLGLALWLLMIGVAWFGGRWLWGPAEASVAAVALAISANANIVAGDARQYAVVLPLLFFAWMLLLSLAHLYRAGDGSRRRLILLWIAYMLCGSVALWCHLLAGVALFALGIVWLAILFGWKLGRTTFFKYGIIAHLAIIILFLPWLASIIENIAYLQASKHIWMTPATFSNFVLVFIWWFPYSAIQIPPGHAGVVFLLVGLAVILIPLALLITARITRRRAGIAPTVSDAAATGLVIFFLHTVILYALDAIEFLQVFHGPRYPMLLFAPAAVSVALMACAAARKLLGSPHAAWLIMIPWFVASLMGTLGYEKEAVNNPVIWLLHDYPVEPDGQRVYLFPEDLLPYYRDTLEGFDVRPASEIARETEPHDELPVIYLNSWAATNRPLDAALLTAICRNQIAAYNTSIRYPRDYPAAHVFKLHKFRPEDARKFAEYPPSRIFRPYADTAVSVASVYGQRQREGWSVVHLDENWVPCRHLRKSPAELRFESPLPPGDYDLHLVVRSYQDEEETSPTLTASMPGTAFQESMTLEPGIQVRTFPLHVEQGLEEPRLVLEEATHTTNVYEAFILAK